MELSLHDYVLRQLASTPRKDWAVVAAGADVSIRTIEKIASREIEYPRVDKVEKLAKYFKLQRRKAS